jgi:glutaredoxin-like protein
MAFINERDRKALEQEFRTLSQPVKLAVFMDEHECEYCRETQQLMEEIAALSDKITVETYDLHRDVSQVGEFQIDKAPAIVVMNGKDYGIRYFGIPSGYEFGSLIEDILDVSRGESGLGAATKAALAKITAPLHFQVFVTPTCPYCPRAVRLAHKMAMENDLIRADMVEAMEFPELSDRYNVMAVPRVVINEDHYFEGALPENAFLAAALQALDPNEPVDDLAIWDEQDEHEHSHAH